MCILSYLPPNVGVDTDGLVNGGLSNPDGHGWAIAAKGMIIMGRSLDLEEALVRFVEARERHPEGPALFHSRWATHGTIRLDNVHPFMVGQSHMTVVAHNGILPAEAHPAKGDHRSDTRVFADDILPRRFRRLDKRGVQTQLAKWCGSFNKLVVLTVDPRYQSSAYLINQEMGEWDTDTGIWHSNKDYRDPYGRWVKTPVTKSAESSAAVFSAAEGYPEDGACVFCQIGEIDRNNCCVECRSCQDCYEHIRDCMCGQRATLAALAVVRT